MHHNAAYIPMLIAQYNPVGNLDRSNQSFLEIGTNGIMGVEKGKSRQNHRMATRVQILDRMHARIDTEHIKQGVGNMRIRESPLHYWMTKFLTAMV